VCPLTPRETPAALANLIAWEATPPVAEGQPTTGPRPKLIYSFNCGPDDTLTRTLQDACEAQAFVKRSFESVEVRFCDLPPEKDVYLRDGETGEAPFGRKAGPNWLFFETMRALRQEARFVFLMETDCQPVAPNWLRKLQRACASNQDAWVVGSHYCGASPLHWSIARHINGNALYNVGDGRFWDFLETRFWPWLNDYAVHTMPDLAYDCGWETFLNRMEMEDAGNYDWIHVRDILHRFRIASFVVNIGGAAEQSGEYLWTREDILKRFPEVAIVHGPLARSLDHRRGPTGLGRPLLRGSARIDEHVVHADGDLGKAVFRRSLWINGQPLEEGDTIKMLFQLQCVKSAGVTVTLREPGGRIIGSKKVSGAGFGQTLKAKFEETIPRSMPYVRMVFHFHGQKGLKVALSELSCDIGRGGALFWRVRRIIGN
jgi:hypothetical protein